MLLEVLCSPRRSMLWKWSLQCPAIRAVADAALLKQGFRTSTSKPGHHQATLHCLVHTLGVAPSTVRVLDGLRKQRNLSDYDGETITHAALQECLAQAQALLALATETLR